MQFFSSWLKNIVFITITITLVNMILPDKMAKYVKVITGFIVMLVIVQPIASLLGGEVYLDDFHLKHSSIMEENITTFGEEQDMASKQESITVRVYKDKLTDSIVNRIDQTLDMKVEVKLDVNEDMNDDSFGTINKAYVIVIEEPQSSIVNIKKINIGKKDDQIEEMVSEKSVNKINNFFLNFYNLKDENITISKNE
ncbi:hypothetical protein GC105_04975 [Alkalibaculum sp. M08DMB]|uniref:Stage III sporulation protein AF n=1 Tax=Alkalibaculum sporogenes TaxID=2655001 RepID=A0A6A7K731_9FIRM|nr:stage III sporulation protein AF [Alkalibaculum sporogenes]MPW25141.1 hypothetical protein [Alkalibaculum sporogenes]